MPRCATQAQAARDRRARRRRRPGCRRAASCCPRLVLPDVRRVAMATLVVKQARDARAPRHRRRPPRRRARGYAQLRPPRRVLPRSRVVVKGRVVVCAEKRKSRAETTLTITYHKSRCYSKGNSRSRAEEVDRSGSAVTTGSSAAGPLAALASRGAGGGDAGGFDGGGGVGGGGAAAAPAVAAARRAARGEWSVHAVRLPGGEAISKDAARPQEESMKCETRVQGVLRCEWSSASTVSCRRVSCRRRRRAAPAQFSDARQ